MKRYDFEWNSTGIEEKESKDGEWVRYKDFRLCINALLDTVLYDFGTGLADREYLIDQLWKAAKRGY